MVLPRGGAKRCKSERQRVAFRTILLALAGEAGKASILAFENCAFSFAFFACFGPFPSCFSAPSSPSRFPARVVQVLNANGAQRTRSGRRARENLVLEGVGPLCFFYRRCVATAGLLIA
jgi:hypothetical protein